MGTAPSGDDNPDPERRRRDEDLMDTSWLDEAFIAAAPVQEKTAEERVAERALADARRAERALRRSHTRRRFARRAGSRSGVRIVALLIVAAMAVTGLYWGSTVRSSVDLGATDDPPLTAAAPADAAADGADPDTSDPDTSETGTSASPADTATAGAAASYPVSSSTVTLRRTAPGGERVLTTQVWRPLHARPAPVVVFAHGMDGHPAKFHDLFRAWAAAGYAVVAPRFPVSADDATGTVAESIADVPEQAADLEFVLTETLAADELRARDTGGRRLFDGTRVALAGLSLGGGTVLRAAYTACCPGLRPELVIAFSPVPFATEQAAAAAPLLLVHGTADATLAYRGSVDLFETAPNRRWLVTLDGAGHAAPYEDSPSAHDELVRTITVDFLDEYLRDEVQGVSRATTAIEASANATIRSASATRPPGDVSPEPAPGTTTR